MLHDLKFNLFIGQKVKSLTIRTYMYLKAIINIIFKGAAKLIQLRTTANSRWVHYGVSGNYARVCVKSSQNGRLLAAILSVQSPPLAVRSCTTYSACL